MTKLHNLSFLAEFSVTGIAISKGSNKEHVNEIPQKPAYQAQTVRGGIRMGDRKARTRKRVMTE